MTDPRRSRLLFGPYRAPPLKRGDHAFCLLRDCPVVVTTWTAAPIPWPRCRVLAGQGAGSGLLVNEALPRAVRAERSMGPEKPSLVLASRTTRRACGRCW